MRGGTPINIDIPTFIKAIKKKEDEKKEDEKEGGFYIAPLKKLGLDGDKLYIDSGVVEKMQLSILPDGGTLSIDTLNGFEHDKHTHTDYTITKDKKDEILKMVGYSEA